MVLSLYSSISSWKDFLDTVKLKTTDDLKIICGFFVVLVL